MKRLALLALLFCACGAEPRGGSVPMGVLLPASIAGGAAKVQIIFARTDAVGCPQYMSANPPCFGNPQNNFVGSAVAVTGPDGKSTNRVVVDMTVAAGGTGQKAISISGVPVGRQYSVIVEAIDASGLLSGHGCGATTGQVKPGANDGVTVNVTDPPSTCNPIF